jgi:hypothetical protein
MVAEGIENGDFALRVAGVCGFRGQDFENTWCGCGRAFYIRHYVNATIEKPFCVGKGGRDAPAVADSLVDIEEIGYVVIRVHFV